VLCWRGSGARPHNCCKIR